MAQLVYELSFKGAASDLLAGAFQGCQVTTAHGITVVRSEVPDQAALQGLISRVHALGLELLDLHLVAEPAGDDDWAVRDAPEDSRSNRISQRHVIREFVQQIGREQLERVRIGIDEISQLLVTAQT